jgi:uncharacterized damage-inducible protein DinB
MEGALTALFRHKTWATIALVDFCRGMPEAVLDAATPGTYGTIRDTFHHLVRAEESYFARVSGRRFFEPLEDRQVGLDELATRIERLGAEWETFAGDEQAQARMVTTSDGWRLATAYVMAQAVHHAGDHRTHILSVLSAHGVEVPEVDVWSYADATGDVEHVAAAQR